MKNIGTLKHFIALIALFSTSIILMADYILSPTINSLYQMFPNRTGMVNFIVSGSYIVIIFTAPIVGKLCNHFGTKRILVTGTLFATIGGILFMFWENPLWMSIMRLLYTIGYGCIQVSATTYINHAYVTDEKKRSSIMGYFHAAETGSGAILGLIAGKLTTISIGTAYQTYYIFIIVLILVIFCLPSVQPKPLIIQQKNIADVSAKKERLGIRYWGMILIFCLFHFAYCAPNLFVSVYVSHNALGSPALCGYLNTTSTVCGFFMALLFGKIYQKLKSDFLILPFFCTMLGLFLIRTIPSIPTSFIAFALFGASNVSMFSFSFTHFPTLVPPSRAADAAAGITMAFGVLMVISSYICTWLIEQMGSFTNTLIVYLGTIILLFVTSIVLFIIHKKSPLKKRKDIF